MLSCIGIHNGGFPDDYNYATYLADTPLGEFLGGAPPPPTPPSSPPPPSGTFANHEAFSETIVAGQWLEVGPYAITSKLRVTMTSSRRAEWGQAQVVQVIVRHSDSAFRTRHAPRVRPRRGALSRGRRQTVRDDARAGDGDADLHVRRGAKPTPTAFECRPFLEGSNESCDMQGPAQVWLAFGGDAPTSNIFVEISYD